MSEKISSIDSEELKSVGGGDYIPCPGGGPSSPPVCGVGVELPVERPVVPSK